MKKTKLRGLFAVLSFEEQKDLILTFHRWLNQQTLVAIRDGSFDVPAESVAAITTIPVETVAMLEYAVANDDRERSLETGVVEIVRSLALMQRGSTGPQANEFLRRHLPGHVFRTLYEAAGLDIETLRYDENFPTDPIVSRKL